MNKSIEIRIQEKHNTLSKSERIVATAVLLHKRDLMQFSMDDLAHLTGVSKTTVARFFKTLGYNSYREARYEDGLPNVWAASPLNVLTAYERADKIDPNLVNHMQLEVTNLSRTAEEIGPELINETIQCLIEAPRIWVLGLRGQYPLALLAQGMFCGFSDDVRVIPASRDIAMDILPMRRGGDLLVAIGSRRRSKQFKLVMKHAKERGLKVILIADLTATESRKYTDLALRCHCRGTYLHETATAMVSLINFLGSAIALQKGHGILERQQRMEDLHEEFGSFGPVPVEP